MGREVYLIAENLPHPAKVRAYESPFSSSNIFSMNQENHFQNNLKRIRKNAGLRQIDVAEMLGHTSADRISHWEKGLAAPGIVNLFKLSIIYGITPQELYGDLYEVIANRLKAESGDTQ